MARRIAAITAKRSVVKNRQQNQNHGDAIVRFLNEV